MIENRQITDHYSLYDMTKTSHVDLQEKNRIVTEDQISKLAEVASLFETAHALLGVPIIVTSGYRCPELNVRVGSSIRSQHLLCEAGDGVPRGMPVDEAFRKLRAAAKEHKIAFGQMIWEKAPRGDGFVEWLHLSLGAPFRDKDRSGQILTMVDGTYTLIERIG